MRRPVGLLFLALTSCGGSAGFGLEVCEPGGGECVDHGPTDPAVSGEGFAALSVSVCTDGSHEATALLDGVPSGTVTPATTADCDATFIEWAHAPRGDIRVVATPSQPRQSFTVTIAAGGVQLLPAIDTVLDAEGDVARLRVYEAD